MGAESLFERLRDGHLPSLARAISVVESRRPGYETLLHDVWECGGRARVVGVTGAPGSGKSTLVAKLVAELRQRGRTVAVIAVDPSSTVTGGAILGDRIRMGELTADDGVFVRSMSNRGFLGGVSRATVDAVAVLDAAGWDDIIIETVGVGQAEVDIVRIADTILVVSVPGLGDDVQSIKAGLLEVADVHVVNKADRPEANRTVADLRTMLTLNGPRPAGAWTVPIVETVALDGRGVAELADACGRHEDWLHEAGRFEQRRRDGVAARLREIAKELVVEMLADPSAGVGFAAAVDAVTARRADPYSAARRLVGAAAATSRDTVGVCA